MNPQRPHIFNTPQPPVAASWPPTAESTPPCPTCGTEMVDQDIFQVNMVGPMQLELHKPPVEVADVVHICRGCGIYYYRRFQAPPVSESTPAQ